MVECSYCVYAGEFKVPKTWRFGFCNIERLECQDCGEFNHNHGTTCA